MTGDRQLRALGLMSGTSMDGIDAAIVETDGVRIHHRGPSIFLPYTEDWRARLRGAVADGAADEALIDGLTRLHAEAVQRCLAEAGLAPQSIDVIGFHGQTILHDPANGVTLQIGDGDLLAALTGVSVVSDFRGNDVAAGGEGAPLAPIIHCVLGQEQTRPLAVLNIGGVANVTWLGRGADASSGHHMLAFDTGPGNAMIDDWVRVHAGLDFDADGALAARGQVDQARLTALMQYSYFSRPPPKSLDRNEFDASNMDGCGLEDGAATLAAFTADSVAAAAEHFPEPVSQWIICGGGRKNGTIMALLAERLAAPVRAAEDAGWDGDALEAEAFALMAVRSLKNMPISFPGTTGVSSPLTGGRLHQV
ncbi:MAG: anhydro-N-acetylmuramic acid kinase [Rhodospirillaceae bacterium]|mgnify:FL=1|nr:anhydro-N-acetylmuramic acid kinase [Rhodospirillaceae bacterium]MBT4674673.1 anhydro-N-acetylmuramic acid kinase [Rhodospirillaceae bacterium]MBT4718122.1 anhydro-N-acetylmuramic acid kinase [Rhodospirillaceae bacterium]MBT5179741.1 anhydro-N-acetylmuramic acid kinase [Rhodospirillaceae bacterium]MBT7031517.1 anhydro-N-acetylmuramic acid kinase [Rhodospirillaceae bacterium]